ncbi:SDR family oxidoreductase [Candidatus Viridilinea mediisalina]|uniref:Short-chain dehydrogenase n=1 Tax=Candidatus Viridilinea mediisalina TaxID=2024553 RepID=A0A2A6RP15_9CHLR|nr:SDR family oxidoreductase [Candidatus Viridilinea mediisalina]PDW04787.1 short-chain dehydrogenase [Candidatus Viridilinea mediisalina]
MKLKGRVAIITGASSGVGYATARIFAREGATVIVAARRRDRLEHLIAEIAGEGHQGFSIPTDVTDPAQVQRLVESTMSLLGRIDMLINCAGGMMKISPIEQFNDADWRSIIDTNLGGVFYTIRAVVPYMKRQRSGIIVNLGSRVGRVGVANISPFSAAKFGVAGLTQALAQELRPHNIYVTNIVSGMINADLAPLNPDEMTRRRLLTTDDVAQAMLWVCTLPPSLRVDELPIMPRQVDL